VFHAPPGLCQESTAFCTCRLACSCLQLSHGIFCQGVRNSSHVTVSSCILALLLSSLTPDQFLDFFFSNHACQRLARPLLSLYPTPLLYPLPAARTAPAINRIRQCPILFCTPPAAPSLPSMALLVAVRSSSLLRPELAAASSTQRTCVINKSVTSKQPSAIQHTSETGFGEGGHVCSSATPKLAPSVVSCTWCSLGIACCSTGRQAWQMSGGLHLQPRRWLTPALPACTGTGTGTGSAAACRPFQGLPTGSLELSPDVAALPAPHGLPQAVVDGCHRVDDAHVLPVLLPVELGAVAPRQPAPEALQGGRGWRVLLLLLVVVVS